jgi:CDP-6-deoxy-D-xylo-4-hexulose-3-dehydrase|tara:strand:+ start:260 stop:1429 length:1170 start_codon:yes stop_codon:yes gene_type:complete
VKSNFKWQLINDSITNDDKKALTDFINEPNQRFTQGKKVQEFEEEWSKWEGVEYSTFVNSGASANYIMASIMKEKKGVGEVIVSPLGWVSDVAPLVNLGFTPVFVDVSMENMSITLDNIKEAVTSKTVGVVLVHVLGFNAINDELIKFCKDNDLFLIEDCCESHGATYKNRKSGSQADVSNFSFYFGHHITTIEGGMVCTNDKEIHEYAKLFRSHGMTREATPNLQEYYKIRYPNVNPLFTFAVPGYNMRNQEINAVLGLEQLKRLDYNIWNRQDNFRLWISCLDPIKYQTNFEEEGSSNFSLPLIIHDSDKQLFEKVCVLLDDEDVEYRIGTAGGGNQARQPYLEKYEYRTHDLTNVNYIHDFGLYIGNHPELDTEQIINLCDKLNSL